MLCRSRLEHEVGWKPVCVPSGGSVELACFYFVEFRKVRDFINRDHPISSERDHLVGVFRSVSDGSYLRAAFLSTILADSAR